MSSFPYAGHYSQSITSTSQKNAFHAYAPSDLTNLRAKVGFCRRIAILEYAARRIYTLHSGCKCIEQVHVS